MFTIFKNYRKAASGLLLTTLAFTAVSLIHPAQGGQASYVAHEGDKFASPAEAWKAIQSAMTEIESLIAAKNLKPVHEAAEKVNAGLGYIKDHPAEGSDKARLEGAVKNALAASDKLHDAADAGDQAKTEAALKTLKATLTVVEKQVVAK
jgi:hypothetical protein